VAARVVAEAARDRLGLMTRSFRTKSLKELRRCVLGLLAMAVLCWLSAPGASQAGELDFPDTSFTLRSIDGLHVIGHAHFAVTTDSAGLTTARGEYRFLDGTYDIDQSILRPGVNGNLPTLVRSDHSFFLADGSHDRESHVEFAQGIGACTIYSHGKAEVSSAKFDFPADTFAGDTVILPLRRFVAAGGGGSMSFHVFNCIPGPKVLKVKVSTSAPAPWDYYTGNLVQVDVKPDFGWINVVIAPFLPQIRAWFDPSDNWSFVGGETTRYYKGLKYMMVRVRPTNAELKAALPSAPRPTVTPVPQAQPTPYPQPTG
jgi:hypothetical protein